jgi:imidazolonepropionase-like amidohydrolase
MGLDGQGGIGTLSPGRWADFVVLDRDPRADILNTRSISSVFIAGKAIMR